MTQTERINFIKTMLGDDFPTTDDSVNKLIGSTPGYVGFEDGGALTEKIRRHPYSVVLFDEIEKAHPDVVDLFLQIADRGVLTDSCGRTVSFRNTYIILPSNVGADLLRSKTMGFSASEVCDTAKTLSELEKHFRIELLARIDDIILFPPLSYGSMLEIAGIKLNELRERLKDVGVELMISDNVAEALTKKMQGTKFGVRRLIRLITTEIENKISALILSEKIEKDSIIKITAENFEIRLDLLKENARV